MNERKLIDEIKLAVQQEAIAGYWNGRVFVSDDKKTYTNIISNSQPIGVGFIVPYDGRWLLVVGSNNSEGRKNIINSKRKRLVSVEENYSVATLYTLDFRFYSTPTPVKFYIGGNAPSKKTVEIILNGGELFELDDKTHIHNRGNNIISYVVDRVIVNSRSVVTTAKLDFYFKKNNTINIIPVNYEFFDPNNPDYRIIPKIFVHSGGYYEEIISYFDNFSLYSFSPPETGFRVLIKDGQKINLPYTMTNRDVMTPSGKLLVKERDITMSAIKRDGTFSEVTLTGSHEVEYVTFNADTTIPKSITEKETVNGEAVICFGANSEIVQQYSGYIEYKSIEYKSSIITENLTTLHPSETTNIIKLKTGTVGKILNTNDFGVIHLHVPNNQNYLAPYIDIPVITTDSKNFSIVFYCFNVNSIATTQQIENYINREISDASLQGEYLLSIKINNEPALIRGNITSKVLNKEENTFTINCAITSIKTDTPSSFLNTLILDNGSFYNYLFRKDYLIDSIPVSIDRTHYDFPLVIKSGYYPYGYYPYYGRGYFDFRGFINKSVIPLLCLAPAIISVFKCSIRQDYGIGDERRSTGDIGDAMFNNYFDNALKLINLNSKTDNIVKNKIYSVVKVEKNKAWIEQWDIKDNGDVKYNKVFQVDYVPLKKPKTDEGEELTIFAHSYYPS